MNTKVLVGVSLLSGLALGSVGGFFAGVSSTQIGQDFLTGMVSVEKPADVAKARTVSRKGFSLQMPGNWKVDTKDVDYNADTYLSIESPGSSYTQFIIYNVESDTKESLDDEVKTQMAFVKNAVQTPFTKWGDLKGHGADLKGRVLGVNRGGVRLFVHSSAGKTMYIYEQYYDDDLRNTQAGFKLIESSFTLKK